MTLAVVVPGSINQLTGGYLYARRMVDGIRKLGRAARVIELAGRFPAADDAARASAASTLAGLPADTIAVIDGLALPGFSDCLAYEAGRLRLIGLIHHPLSLETGLPAAESRRYAALEARLWPLLRGILCPSTATAQAVIASGVQPRCVAVAAPGTDKPAWTGERRPQAPLRLLSVASITPRKGHLLLVEALAGLRDHDWRLTCIGSLERDLAAAAALRRAIALEQLGGRITLVGERPAEVLSAAYRDADLFVLPSHHEGYGMVYAEALAHGLPVIATTAGAIFDTVPPGAAVLVPPGDALALREALRRVFSDEHLRAHLAAQAVLAATALPDWSAAAGHFAAALDRLAV